MTPTTSRRSQLVDSTRCLTNMLRATLATAAIGVLFGAVAGHAAEGDMAGHSHVAVFLGAGEESSDSSHWHEADALGFEYEFRLSNRWGIGAVVEDLNVENRGNTVVVMPISLHVGKGLRAFAGPGVEFKGDSFKEKPLIRLGAGYEFHLGKHWTMAPELIYDLVDRKGSTWLAGIAIGYGF